MVKYIVCFLLIIVWIYVLRLLTRAQLHFWKFMVGSLGLFIFLMVLVRPIMTQPLARVVAAFAGVVGNLTNTFTAYFKYGILFIESATGTMTLQIDFECSGIIEIIAFLSLLTFFRVYELNERLLVGVAGVVFIILANALRIIIICEMIHFFGVEMYSLAHTVVGRLVFYALSVCLYFYVFTKPHIVRMKVGTFTYGNG